MKSTLPRLPGAMKVMGGKAAQVDQLLELFPRDFQRFVDPFAGGCSLPYRLREIGFPGPILLSDANRPLMAVWQALKAEPERLITILEPMRALAGREVFELYRDELDACYKPQVGLLLPASSLDLVEIAARWVYLNRRTYSGLSRVNLSGGLNMPWGEDAALPAVDTLRRYAALMATCELEACDFEGPIQRTVAGDLLNLDPPYLALDGKVAFTAYAGRFGVRQHRRLEELCGEADQRGVRFLACNADCREARAIWGKWNVRRVMVARPGNSDGEGRGAVGELRITNF